jgi:cytidylate kinase
MYMKLPEIIGIAGTNASGKDTLGILRFEIQKAKMVSLSDILRLELDKRGLSHERINLRELGDEWRAESGSGVLADKTIEEYLKVSTEDRHGLSIVSVRHPEEAKSIQNAGGIIIWVDADRLVRYNRIHSREIDRIEDKVTFEQFCIQEDAEMIPEPGHESSLRGAAVRSLANVFIENNYGSVDEYKDFLVKEFEIN